MMKSGEQQYIVTGLPNTRPPGGGRADGADGGAPGRRCGPVRPGTPAQGAVERVTAPAEHAGGRC